MRRLGMGPLLGELARKMRRKAAASASVGGAGACAGGPQMLVHATHDAALAALLATLDVFDDRWVPALLPPVSPPNLSADPRTA